MGIFGKLNNDGLEEAQDRLGGYQALDTDLYTGTIKMAYAGQSAAGAQSITFLVNLESGQEYRETVYVTNRKGENFYLNKNDNSKKVPLPGFTTADDICLCTAGTPLSEQNTEEKMVNVYDSEQRKEVPKAVPVLIDLLGQKITLGILNLLENKSEKNGDEYVPIADTRTSNVIDKVFHTETRLTTAEARNGKPAEFIDKWLERNKGKQQDRRTIKDGEGPKTGRPGSAPQASGGSAPRKSLFGGA